MMFMVIKEFKDNSVTHQPGWGVLIEANTKEGFTILRYGGPLSIDIKIGVINQVKKKASASRNLFDLDELKARNRYFGEVWAWEQYYSQEKNYLEAALSERD